MAEALMNQLGKDKFEAFSAGARPSGIVHPMTLEVLSSRRMPLAGLRSKSLGEFENSEIDIIITVCDSARESCPVWTGNTVTLHWSFPDPAAFQGDENETREYFDSVFDMIKMKIESFLSE